MHRPRRLIVFTDLDGTLLDFHTYSMEAAGQALHRLDELGCPLVTVSSKTRAEVDALTGLPARPLIFITENGSGVYVHQDMNVEQTPPPEIAGDYAVLCLGSAYADILRCLDEAQKACRVVIHGFSSMSTSEVSTLTGLDLDAAARAKAREFSEPFVFKGTADGFRRLTQALERSGMRCIKGDRFWHAIGSRCDKGIAVRKAFAIFRENYPGTIWESIALGDSPSDVPLLEAADTAVIIKRHDGTSIDYRAKASQTVIRSQDAGPVGWNEVILKLTEEREGHG